MLVLLEETAQAVVQFLFIYTCSFFSLHFQSISFLRENGGWARLHAATKVGFSNKLFLNVKKEVEDFTSNLHDIQAAPEDAEQRQVKEASVRNWLDKLKQIPYEMGDVLDEWNNEILKQ